MNKESITERIQTYEDALQATGRPDVDFSNVPEDLREYISSVYKAVVVTEAINEGYKPDWDNNNEKKWRPWFYMSPSGFAFYDTTYGDTHGFAGSGSRLCYQSEANAEYSAKQFFEIWREIQLG